MSDPIDFIDLTVDSPVNKTLRSYNRNGENLSKTNTTRKLRKHKLSIRQAAETSVIEVPCENAGQNKRPMEIIDIDKFNLSAQEEKVYCINDSTEENAVPLTCPICFEELKSNMRPMSTRCGHIFCGQCLELAIRSAKRCPKCKRAVKLQSCTRLYF